MPFVPNPVLTAVRACSNSRLCANCSPATLSPLGQRRIAELQPWLDRAWIETQQQLAAEIREYRRGGRFEFLGLPEVRTLVEKSRIAGAALETTEIRDVVCPDRGSEWRKSSQPPAACAPNGLRYARFPPVFSSLTSCAPSATRFCRTARSTITPRRNSAAFAAKSKSSAAPFRNRCADTCALSEGGTVQDELITIRGERFVIPVKVEQKRRVQG